MIQIFISYSHKDLHHKDEVKKFLRPLLYMGGVQIWDDYDIEAGGDWEAEIKKNLYGADIILLLVSPDSLASDYFYGKEVKVSLERHQKQEAIVVPVILRPCTWMITPLGQIEAIPEKGKAITTWASQDEAFTDVAHRIGEMVNRIKAGKANQTQTQKALHDFEALRNAAEQLFDNKNWKAAQKGYEDLLGLCKPGYVPDKAAIQGRIDSCKQHAKAEDDKAATHQADNDVWELVRESTDPKVIRKYLERHPGTRHKAVALARIAALEKVDEVVKSADTPVDKVPLPIKKVPALEIIEPAMVHVPGGRFKMGSNDYDNEKPIHDVELKEFWIGKYLVTVGEYLRFADDTKSHFPVWLERDNEYNVETGSKDYYKSLGFSRSADNFPIVGVSWEDARIYCEWLSNKTGKRYRLPTEAEWEYAARGGHKSKHYKYSGSNSIKEVAWYAENGSSKPQPVGKKKANELGLFDMSGNVWEWCGDWYGEYPSEPQINPTGPGSGSSRVYRGGSWHDYADYCRVSHRFHHTPGRRNSYLGFRIVLSFH